MKKIFGFIIIIVIVILAMFFDWYNTKIKTAKEIEKFNSELELYTSGNITGVDLTTVINKAIDNNEQYNITKNSSDIYEDDDKYALKVYIKLSEDGEYFPMEAFDKIGVSGFTSAYATAVFKAVKIQKNTYGRISKIYFEIVV
jgi:hypothetical protein